MTKISNQYSLTNILTADLANSRLGINNVSPTVALDVTGAGKFSSSVNVQNFLTVSGATTLVVPTSGKSIEMVYRLDGANDYALIQAYDRTASVFKRLDLNASMTILPSGNVGIGTSSPAVKFQLEAPTTPYGQFYILNTGALSGESTIHFGRTSQTNEQRWTVGQGTAGIGDSFGFYTSASNKAVLTTAGVWSTAGGGTSDLRKKQNIEYIQTDGIELIKLLKPAKFEFIDNPEKTRRGFIAQDVLKVIPNLVLGDGELEGGTYGLDYDGILALAVKAIQELSAKVSLLENK